MKNKLLAFLIMAIIVILSACGGGTENSGEFDQLRNITVLIAPVEILMLLIFRNRIGDILAGTTVVDDGESSGW